jgi:hypothetical protein
VKKGNGKNVGSRKNAWAMDLALGMVCLIVGFGAAKLIGRTPVFGALRHMLEKKVALPELDLYLVLVFGLVISAAAMLIVFWFLHVHGKSKGNARDDDEPQALPH